jgi:hypothetical protein
MVKQKTIRKGKTDITAKPWNCFVGFLGFGVKRSGFGVRACVHTLAPQIRVSTMEIPKDLFCLNCMSVQTVIYSLHLFKEWNDESNCSRL